MLRDRWAWIVVAGMIASVALPVNADHASLSQCTCEPEGDYLSGITNASLCVLTPGGGEPVCNITVLCLSDGTGPDCSPHAEALKAADVAATNGSFDLNDFSFDLRDFTSALGNAIMTGMPPSTSSANGAGLSPMLKDLPVAGADFGPCFAQLVAGADAAEVDIEAAGLRCSFQPRFHVLTLRPIGAFSEGRGVAVQIVAPE